MFNVYEIKQNGSDYEVVKNITKVAIKNYKRLKEKTLTKKIIESLEQQFDVTITNYLISGRIDLASGTFKGGYVLFGKDLPFRFISYEEVII